MHNVFFPNIDESEKDLSNSLDAALESSNRVSGLIMELLNKTNLLNALSNIEFDTEWLKAQTVGPGPTASTMITNTTTTESMAMVTNFTETSTPTASFANFSIPLSTAKPSENFTGMPSKNFTGISNENFTRIPSEYSTGILNENATFIPNENSTTTVRSVTTSTLKPSVFDGILQPSHFEFIENSGLLIATGLALQEELPVEVYDLHYSSSVISCQNLEPFPLPVWGATGGLLNDQYPILCGGIDNGTASNKCHTIGNNF